MSGTENNFFTTLENEHLQYNTYDLFILVISILSLLVMVLYYLPTIGQTETAIALALDTVFSFIFLYDFFRSLSNAPDRWAYFKKGGWLDLLGSIPAITIFRIFRIARLIRIIRTMRRTTMWCRVTTWHDCRVNCVFKRILYSRPCPIRRCLPAGGSSSSPGTSPFMSARNRS